MTSNAATNAMMVSILTYALSILPEANTDAPRGRASTMGTAAPSRRPPPKLVMSFTLGLTEGGIADTQHQHEAIKMPTSPPGLPTPRGCDGAAGRSAE